MNRTAWAAPLTRGETREAAAAPLTRGERALRAGGWFSGLFPIGNILCPQTPVATAAKSTPRSPLNRGSTIPPLDRGSAGEALV